MNDDGLLTIEDIVLTTKEVLNFKEGVQKTPTSICIPLTKKYHVGDIIEPNFEISPSDAPVVYTWYKTDTKNASLTNSNKIDGATSSTYTLTDADVDKYIHFKVEVVGNDTYIGSSATMTTANTVQKTAPKIYFGMTHYWSKVRTGKTNLKDTLLLGNLPDNKMVATVENNVFKAGPAPFGGVSGMACAWFAVPKGTKIVSSVDADGDAALGAYTSDLVTPNVLGVAEVQFLVDGVEYDVYADHESGDLAPYNSASEIIVTIESLGSGESSGSGTTPPEEPSVPTYYYGMSDRDLVTNYVNGSVFTLPADAYSTVEKSITISRNALGITSRVYSYYLVVPQGTAFETYTENGGDINGDDKRGCIYTDANGNKYDVYYNVSPNSMTTYNGKTYEIVIK